MQNILMSYVTARIIEVENLITWYKTRIFRNAGRTFQSKV